jgi:membrane protein
VIADFGSEPSHSAASVADVPGTGGSRLSAVVVWLRGRTDTSIGRLALLWFRRYFEASRNSGAAASAYITLSVLPAALVFIGIFNLARGDENAFADRVVNHMKLDGATAEIVRDLFGTTADNVAAASVAVVIGFLIWGISIGQLYQDVYARAWRIHVGSAADQLRYTIWFFVVSGILAVMFGSAGELRASGWLIALPIWIGGSIVFWLWTPRYLLQRQVSIRSLLPGALLATFVLSGTIATSPLWIGPTINQNAKAFGAFGAVIALFAYILIGTTLTMVCAVFAPVWAEWQQGEHERKEPGVRPADAEPALRGAAH